MVKLSWGKSKPSNWFFLAFCNTDHFHRNGHKPRRFAYQSHTLNYLLTQLARAVLGQYGPRARLIRGYISGACEWITLTEKATYVLVPSRSRN